MLTSVIFVKKLWSYVRRYGVVIVLSVAAVVAFVALRKRVDISNILNLINRERKLHAEEVERLNVINEREIVARDVAAKRALAAVVSAEKQFAAENVRLDDKVRRDIANTVKKHSGTPDELTNKLADQFGLVFVPSEDG